VSDKKENSKQADLIDHLMNELPEVKRGAVEKAIANDPILASEHADFESLLQKTRNLATPPSEIPDLSAKIMAVIQMQEQSPWWQKISPATLAPIAGLAAAVALLFVVTQDTPTPSFLTVGAPHTGTFGYSFKANYNDARIAEPGDFLVNSVGETTVIVLCFLTGLALLITGRFRKSRKCYIAALISFLVTVFSVIWIYSH